MPHGGNRKVKRKTSEAPRPVLVKAGHLRGRPANQEGIGFRLRLSALPRRTDFPRISVGRLCHDNSLGVPEPAGDPRL